MSMDTADQHLAIQFASALHVRAQQFKSRLRPYVKMVPITGADEIAYDGLGQVEVRELTGRFNTTQPADIEHFRRKIPRRRFEATIYVDKYDLEGKISDPQGDYASAIVAGMERRLDLLIYQAMFADVQTGRRFETTVTAANDGVLTVNATAGLTLAKLLEARQNFLDNEVGNDGGAVPGSKFCLGITGDEHTVLQQISQLTSGDWSSQYSLENGMMVKAVGIELIPFGALQSVPIIPVSGGVRTSFVMAQGAIALAMSRDWEVTIKDRPDMVDTKQIQVVGVMGAVRTEGKRIQKFTTTDI